MDNLFNYSFSYTYNGIEEVPAIVSLISSLFSLALGILMIVAMWKIFQKAGEKGWKSLIPFYNTYTLYKICWKTLWFWVYLLCSLVIIVLAFVMMWDVIAYATGVAGVSEETFALTILGLTGVMILLSIPVMVLQAIQCFKLSKAFGHDVGWFFGLWLVNIVFYPLLAFGDSKYVGKDPAAQAAAAAAAYYGQPVAYAPVAAQPVPVAQPTQAEINAQYAQIYANNSVVSTPAPVLDPTAVSGEYDAK